MESNIFASCCSKVHTCRILLYCSIAFQNWDILRPDWGRVGIRDSQSKLGLSRLNRNGWTLCDQNDIFWVPTSGFQPRLPLWTIKHFHSIQGSYGHEKSWRVIEFENEFSRPGKVMDFRENGQGHGTVMEFHFYGPKIPCCLKTGNILLVIEQKYAPNRLGFQHFWAMENLNWSWKSHGKVIEFYCPISVWTLQSQETQHTKKRAAMLVYQTIAGH